MNLLVLAEMLILQDQESRFFRAPKNKEKLLRSFMHVCFKFLYIYKTLPETGLLCDPSHVRFQSGVLNRISQRSKKTKTKTPVVSFLALVTQETEPAIHIQGFFDVSSITCFK